MKYQVAIIQIDVTRDKAENLIHANKLIRSAAKQADIIVLPEMFNCPYNANTFSKYAEQYPGETTQMMSDLAKELEILLIAGSIPELEDDIMYNTSYVFDHQGTMIARHRKAHLFDVAIEGGITFKESDVLGAGHQATVFEWKGLKAGLCICYDMRFPELARTMVNQGAEAIFIPAAFNTTTGPAHWHITARARAVDNQVYTVLASPARSSELSYKAYGHSMIVDPWGRIVDEANTAEEIVAGEIDQDYIKKIRSELPLLKHRKHAIYDC